MKVSDTEWQWDRNKLTIYFTAEKRVDFRALVRDLASHVPHPHRAAADRRARRGRAARRRRTLRPGVLLLLLAHGALAGQPRPRQGPASLAQSQSQISGGCGRLLCCLKYEHEFYVTARKRFPKEGKTLHDGARAPRGSSRWTSSASGCSSGARSTGPGSSAGSAARGGRSPGRCAVPPAKLRSRRGRGRSPESGGRERADLRRPVMTPQPRSRTINAAPACTA